MAGLAIYMSNRTEILADQLAASLAEPPSAVMSPEIVVVQSRGMQRWLSMKLARANGICANVRFPFPNAFLADTLRRLVPDIALPSPNDLLAMAFRLIRLLPAHLPLNDFRRLRGYLSDDPQQLKLFQLSRKIAFLFDQYIVYRPEMLIRWEEGRAERDPDGRWQAQLWRALLKETTPGQHLSWPRRIGEVLASARAGSDQLPARVALFGISYLPPLHFHLLTELARVIQLNFFWLNPCRHYWGDIVSERQAQRLHLKVTRPGEDLHLESGNRLLAAFGSLGREFLEMMAGRDCELFESYETPADGTMLSNLQADVLELREHPAGADPASSAAAPADAADADRSIQVHSCHSPLREIEVLYDNILAELEADPQLSPDDIIVMAPDIQLYAPYVQAVFGAQTDEHLRLPYSIADQNLRGASGVADGFLALIELPDSRFGAARILRLLEYPGIRESFDLAPSDMPRIESWVRDAQIRWGIDSRSRLREGLPDFEENTWEAGFKRMLMGCALPAGEAELFEGILPYDHIEGTDSEVLGNLIDFIARLDRWCTALAGPKPVSRWQALLLELLEDFFDPAAVSQRDVQALRQAVDRLTQAAAAAQFDAPVDLAVIKALLCEQLEAAGGAGGFLGQGVTFCALLPMRSIPFEMLCLVGMDHAAFPRDSQPLNFDLMARHPQPGDRSRRKDDKYLFLEAVLSARKILYISYGGQNIQDNGVIPPSVLVRELLEALDPPAAEQTEASDARLTVQHRLQAFSADYFSGDGHLFTYSRQNLLVAEGAREQMEPPPFFGGPLDPSPAEDHLWRRLDLETLARFLGHPARYLLNRRLGLYLEDDGAGVEDCERFSLSGLERYLLGEQMVAQRLGRKEPSNRWEVLKASGRIPPGNTGRTAYEQLAGEVDAFAQRLAGRRLPAEPIRRDVELISEGMHLGGTVPAAFRGGCVTVRFARTKARDLLQTWVYHLGWAISPGEEAPDASYLLCTDNAWRFSPAPESRELLKELLSLFRCGMSAPLAFFPQSAYVFADHLINRGQSEDSAVNAARRVWQGNDFAAGEADDPYMALCFRQRNPLDESFKELALRVFRPLFEHLRSEPPVI